MSYATNFGVVPEPVYAGAGARIAATAIDCGTVCYVVQKALCGVDVLCARYPVLDAQTRVVFVQAALPVALLVYLIACEGGVGATLGKMMMQLRVRGADGRRLGFGRAAARNLAKAVSVLTLGAGFLPCLLLGRRQALHDLVAACVVVRA